VENPSANIVTIPIEECNPLAAISGNLSYTSQELGIDDDVVDVGDYYYNHNTRAIERRTNKRKRGEATLKKEYSKRSIKWKEGKYPKKNAIQTTSTLNAIACANSMLIYEIGEALDISRSGVLELEATTNTIRESLASDFNKESSTTKQLQKEI